MWIIRIFFDSVLFLGLLINIYGYPDKKIIESSSTVEVPITLMQNVETTPTPTSQIDHDPPDPSLALLMHFNHDYSKFNKNNNEQFLRMYQSDLKDSAESRNDFRRRLTKPLLETGDVQSVDSNGLPNQSDDFTDRKHLENKHQELWSLLEIILKRKNELDEEIKKAMGGVEDETTSPPIIKTYTGNNEPTLSSKSRGNTKANTVYKDYQEDYSETDVENPTKNYAKVDLDDCGECGNARPIIKKPVEEVFEEEYNPSSEADDETDYNIRSKSHARFISPISTRKLGLPKNFQQFDSYPSQEDYPNDASMPANSNSRHDEIRRENISYEIKQRKGKDPIPSPREYEENREPNLKQTNVQRRSQDNNYRRSKSEYSNQSWETNYKTKGKSNHNTNIKYTLEERPRAKNYKNSGDESYEGNREEWSTKHTSQNTNDKSRNEWYDYPSRNEDYRRTQRTSNYKTKENSRQKDYNSDNDNGNGLGDVHFPNDSDYYPESYPHRIYEPIRNKKYETGDISYSLNVSPTKKKNRSGSPTSKQQTNLNMTTDVDVSNQANIKLKGRRRNLHKGSNNQSKFDNCYNRNPKSRNANYPETVPQEPQDNASGNNNENGNCNCSDEYVQRKSIKNSERNRHSSRKPRSINQRFSYQKRKVDILNHENDPPFPYYPKPLQCSPIRWMELQKYFNSNDSRDLEFHQNTEEEHEESKEHGYETSIEPKSIYKEPIEGAESSNSVDQITLKTYTEIHESVTEQNEPKKEQVEPKKEQVEPPNEQNEPTNEQVESKKEENESTKEQDDSTKEENESTKDQLQSYGLNLDQIVEEVRIALENKNKSESVPKEFPILEKRKSNSLKRNEDSVYLKRESGFRIPLKLIRNDEGHYSIQLDMKYICRKCTKRRAKKFNN